MNQVIARVGKENTAFLEVSELLSNYRISLETCNRSCTTITWYLDILHDFFFKFLNTRKKLKPVSELNREELRAYIQHLQCSKRWPNRKHNGKDYGRLSPFTIQGRVRAIKAFWGWLFDEGHIKDNPLVKFPLPKVPKMLVKTLTVSQVKSLLGAVDKDMPKGAMYHCILIILLDTGVRIGELVSIRLPDVNMLSGYIMVVGKGKKERVVPFHKITRKELKSYIMKYRPNLCNQDSPHLFPKMDGDHITISSVQQYIRRLVAKAGLQGIKCHPHIFRHTFATMFLARGGSEIALMTILGHASLQTTQKYIHLQTQHIRQQHARYSPMEDIFPGKH